ncbi:hypothetical protein SADUNF_Sadunf15G0040700 [Salix dunnii]|uniref:Uncharacterized protein n=1 Tax=Salix dunnii TaxID=1413687 RepID=A0A835JDE0_9ROSI|nr:hypothetical protein SADUNF_Sadunf15G0040700 [Salix dunnii]
MEDLSYYHGIVGALQYHTLTLLASHYHLRPYFITSSIIVLRANMLIKDCLLLDMSPQKIRLLTSSPNHYQKRPFSNSATNFVSRLNKACGEVPTKNFTYDKSIKQHIASRFQRLLESNGSFELHLPLRLQSPRHPILSEGLWIFQTSLLLHKPLTELSILPASIRMKLRNTDAKDFMISLFFDR